MEVERQGFGVARAKPLAGPPSPSSWFCQEARHVAADKTMEWDGGGHYSLHPPESQGGLK